MKKDNDTIKVSSESKLQLPLANLIGIILVVSGAVFGMQILQVVLAH